MQVTRYLRNRLIWSLIFSTQLIFEGSDYRFYTIFYFFPRKNSACSPIFLSRIQTRTL